PAMVSGIQGVDDFLVECEGTLMYQPCVSPTWDTALAMKALLESGMDPAHPMLARLPAGVAAIGSSASTIRITAESSTSGNQSLANSKAQPPGSSSGFRIDQSPGRKIWFATSHSAARASIGCAGS